MVGWTVVLWGAVLFAQDPAVPGSAEAEADAAITSFRLTFYRPGATEDEQVIALRTLGKTVHPKTLAVIGPLVTEGVIATRIAAALVLTGFAKIDGTPAALIKAYQFCEKRLAVRPVRIRIIQTLGEIDADSAAGLINAAILDRDPWIARAAAKAAGKIRGISSIDPLIKRLEFLESKEGERPAGSENPVPDPGKGSPSPGGAAGDGGMESHRKSERQVLQSPIHEALTSITRQRHTCAETWLKWWTQVRRDFKVPK